MRVIIRWPYLLALPCLLPLLLLPRCSGQAHACGPYLATRALMDAKGFTDNPPEAIFTQELQNILAPPPTTFVRVPWNNAPQAVTQFAALLDLSQALYEQNIDPFSAAKTLQQLKRFRQEPHIQPLPQLLPDEFRLYLLGAQAYYTGDLATASQHWRAVLDLPFEQRRYRSTWAAHMLALISCGESATDSDDCVWLDQHHHFELVRKMALAGYGDTLGLAEASLRIGQVLEFNEDNPVQSLLLTLEWTKHRPVAGARRLWLLLPDLLEPELVGKLAGNAKTRQLVTIYILSRPWRFVQYAQSWLNTLGQMDIQEVTGAEYLAWLAYRQGDHQQATRWVSLANKESTVGRWIKARLATRNGDIEQAVHYLSQVVQALPSPPPDYFEDTFYWHNWGWETEPKPRAQAELALLKLNRESYVEALALFMEANSWNDAAYVADRVLTVQELIAYVDANTPNAPIPSSEYSEEFQPDLRHWLRILLGRRLVRIGHYQQAHQYLDTEAAQYLKKYQKHLKVAQSWLSSDSTKATAYWKAALTVRKHGMEMMGTEIAPDWTTYSGTFAEEASSQARQHLAQQCRQEEAPICRSLAPGSDELSRISASEPKPNQRFHYRSIAAELAQKATDHMPTDSNLAGVYLCYAQKWSGDTRYWVRLIQRNQLVPTSAFGADCTPTATLDRPLSLEY